jgi:hypothetical protein
MSSDFNRIGSRSYVTVILLVQSKQSPARGGQEPARTPNQAFAELTQLETQGHSHQESCSARPDTLPPPSFLGLGPDLELHPAPVPVEISAADAYHGEPRADHIADIQGFVFNNGYNIVLAWKPATANKGAVNARLRSSLALSDETE